VPFYSGGGGGGGAAFNGGTITNPLGINSDPGDVTLAVFADVGQTADLVDVTSQAAGNFSILADGGLNENTNNAMTNDALGIGLSNALAVNAVNVSQAFAPFATVWRVNKSGYMGVGLHAAPADAAVATGECMVWFDQTNGAAKLMLKGKTADGTVATAAIALA
jgi:hypothetical protein